MSEDAICFNLYLISVLEEIIVLYVELLAPHTNYQKYVYTVLTGGGCML